MNDTFRDLKARVRRLDEVLSAGAGANMEFAQAVSQAHRALRRGDRSREPDARLEALVQRAEALVRGTG
jgi:predicted HAD superfamily Cof-like phosphohydrolase